ncbi:hypothetical protein FRC17_004985 [Serendipita sp. 399]|nr:hypothetical protein FRC17_004985 [Serendipita sp. 399]
MALVPIVNSGQYYIRNLAFGRIRDDEGALGAKGDSKSEEIKWQVIRLGDGTYILQSQDPIAPANPGIAISEIEKRYYISVEPSATATRWRLQPIFNGSKPIIYYVIYELPSDNNCPAVGHWELNNSDKKEPVKLNRFPEDEENKNVPSLYKPNALWIFEPIPGTVPEPSSYY